ncbi:MAG: hypothetical protein J6252_00770 [Clostridia bacterium]|nr:hypothetical protein [Clostridia bacterium]
MTFDGFFDKYIVGGYLFLRRFFVFRFILYIIRTWYLGIPAALFYVLHRTLGWPLWPVWAALGVWMFILFVRLLFVRIMFRAAREDGAGPKPERENRNPYSAEANKALPPEKTKDENGILPE